MILGVLPACSGERPDEPTPPGATEVLRLSQPRAVHRATLLGDGTVLITGGCTAPGCGGFDEGRTAELFDPQRGIVTAAVMSTPRASGTATLLRDGRVLLTGGYPGEGQAPTAAAEVYDAKAGKFSSVGDLGTGRADHSASLLPDGRILIAGGFDASGRALATTEVFDPATHAFSSGPGLSAPRAAHVAATVNGAVLLVGGTEGSEALRTTDVFRNGRWTHGPRLLARRVKMGIAVIGRTRVLVVGGATAVDGRERLASTEIVDLPRGAVTPGPRLRTGEYKLDGAVAALDDGRVVIPSGDRLALFDPRTARLTILDARIHDARSFKTLTAIEGNQILVAGGYDDSITPTDEAVLITIPQHPS